MSFMKGRRYGLSLGLMVQYLTLQHCPRCVAKRGISVPMTISEGGAKRPPVASQPSARLYLVPEIRLTPDEGANVDRAG